MADDDDITIKWSDTGPIRPLGAYFYADGPPKQYRQHWWQFWKPRRPIFWVDFD